MRVSIRAAYDEEQQLLEATSTFIMKPTTSLAEQLAYDWSRIVAQKRKKLSFLRIRIRI